MSAIIGAHASSGHTHIQIANMQNTDTPDINLERDLVPEEVLLGMENTELASDNKKFKVNIVTIVISALIFLAILAWFDFAQTTFYVWIYPPSEVANIPSSAKLAYALGITMVILVIIALLIYYFWDSIRL